MTLSTPIRVRAALSGSDWIAKPHCNGDTWYLGYVLVSFPE